MRLFQWMRRRKTTINSILITIFTSLLFNTISECTESFFDNPRSILEKIFLSNNLSGILTWISIILFLVINMTYTILHKALLKSSLRNEFVQIMKDNTGASLKDSVYPGCLSWGEGKTVLLCNDIIYGWKADNIIISDYDDNMYSFFRIDDAEKYYGIKTAYPTQEEFFEFKNSDSFKEIIRKGNNLSRFMLKSGETNYDKNNRKLLLFLARTEWSQTSYIWDWFGKKNGTEVNANSLMNEYARGISTGGYTEQYLPNSLCMHLLIETLDNKIIKARISSNKRNDNPGTWAFTLGEQLESVDFMDENNFYPDFMLRWLQRAFKEEYKMDENVYRDIVEEDTFRVLSLDFESDRYNFALLCTVRLNYSYEVFSRKIQSLLSRDEAIELGAIEVNDIPGILTTYSDCEMRKRYHPSSYLRLLVFYMHKLGFGRAQNSLVSVSGDGD